MNKICLLFPLVASTAAARPSPERLGTCSGFKGDDLFLHAPSIVRSGAGVRYVSLTAEKTVFAVESPNSRPDVTPTSNGRPAVSYRRDASFFQVLTGAPVEGEDASECTQSTVGNVNICSFDPSGR